MQRPPFIALLRDLRLSPELLESLQDAPWKCSFLALMRRIGADANLDPIGTARLPQTEPFRLGQMPNLAFAPSEIARVSVEHGRLKTRLFGLGMLGPNGPLPLHITEIARERQELRNDPTLANFLDLFHHRYLTIFYRAWAASQATAGLDRPDREKFTFYIASLSGHDVKEIEQGPLPSHARLSASPHLIREARNPDGLAATLAHYFDVPVSIDENVFHWMERPLPKQSRLGVPGASSTMGVDAMLGDHIPDRHGKFRIVMGPLDLKSYLRFTPQGDQLLRMVEWVRAFVGQELRWELKLTIRPECASPAKLGDNEQLGWSTWLGESPADVPLTGMLFEPEDYVPKLKRAARSPLEKG
ncbi:type VI secretion system baseplate subunit TssG [Paraburkholderia sp. J67]|uniref:type VI secretion system baseplate subunit TssG n=1 Tax=Paraburkholderia sp. J67 TaxID=2805435 RepID=UPI002ABDBD17|nr:type VI secretion system baseplate subunit TssG [Paraburkholderia sp. J67]